MRNEIDPNEATWTALIIAAAGVLLLSITEKREAIILFGVFMMAISIRMFVQGMRQYRQDIDNKEKGETDGQGD